MTRGQPGIGVRILLIDDDEHVRHVVARLLRGDGFEVIEAADGVEGLRVLYDPKRRPDCIILDLIMPRMSGQRFLEIKRDDEFFENIPIIVFSGAASGIDPRSLEGATLFVPKPVTSIDELSSVIVRVVRSGAATLPPGEDE